MAISDNPVWKNAWMLGVVALFGLVFGGIGLSFGIGFGKTIRRYREAQHWPEVPARILRAELVSEDSGEGDTFWVKAEYEYSYQGQRYTGRRVSLHGGSDNVGSFWFDVYRELDHCRRTGRVFHCYINPADPSQALLYRDLRSEMVAFSLVFVLLFGGGGLFFLAGGCYAFFAMQRRAALADARPDEPWMWRKDWARGEVLSSVRSDLALSIVATVAWNAVAIPLGFLIVHEIVQEHSWLIILALIFPAIGLVLVAWPVVCLLRWWKYGQSVFKMASVPAVVGGRLAGVICTTAKIRPNDGFRLALTCWQSGGETTTTLWTHEQVVEREILQEDVERSAIPVLFEIPFDCQPTADETRTAWKLEVKAAVPGIDYRATFEVPVFKTSESDPGFAADEREIAPK